MSQLTEPWTVLNDTLMRPGPFAAGSFAYSLTGLVQNADDLIIRLHPDDMPPGVLRKRFRGDRAAEREDRNGKRG